MSGQIVVAADLPWHEFPEAPGVRYKVLRRHSDHGISLLLQFDPGAAYPAHRHPQGEEYYVLQGILHDGGRSYGPDTYVFHPPDSVHHPRSDSGCTLLVVLPAHIELVGTAGAPVNDA